MRYVSAYLLAVLGGQESPSAKDIRRIIESVGVEVDEGKLELVISKMKGKNISELQEEGKKTLANVFGSAVSPDVIPEGQPSKVKEPGKITDEIVSDGGSSDDEDAFNLDIFG